MPLFSIIIPAYNNASLLVKCLDSIRSQTFGDWEAIIVNDASTDETSRTAHSIADENPRFAVIDKPENEGRHLARKTGTAAASGGYIMYLDADDELVDTEVLACLAQKAMHEPADIIRFGLVAVAENGTPTSTAESFTAWSNKELDEQLPMPEVMALAFRPSRNWAFPWHVTHRLFENQLAKRSFAMMTDDRLQRAEDAYEYLVLASQARSERSCCEIEGYLYHMGTGVTNAKSLTAADFARETRDIWKCAGAAENFAASTGSDDIIDCASGLKAKLLESMGNDLNERVSEHDRPLAEREFIGIVGPELAAVELWRFVRDRSWRYLVDDFIPCREDPLFREADVARGIILPDDARQHKSNQHLAETYLSELRRRMNDAESEPTIRIFATTHKHAAKFDSRIIQLVQAGAANAPERFWDTLHDDDGEQNISSLNPYYCELTVQYWAWKNIDADYYGFCHYRRYFDFSDEKHNENGWGEIVDGFIDGETQERYGLDDDTIERAVQGYDVITTEFKRLAAFESGEATPGAHWHSAQNLRDCDLENMLALLLMRHPDYAEDIEAFMNGERSCFCNMYIMRKKAFFAYCEWLFPLLEEFVEISDFSTASHETMRTPGHLAERLFNIYYLHQMRTGANWKTKELQCVHFLDPDRPQTLFELSALETGCKPIVPIALAADNSYVPMLTTTIYSMLRNASGTCHYDIIVMTTDISEDNQSAMRAFLQPIRSASLRFLNVWPLIQRYKLSTNNPHIGIETYYRFLIQDALPHYDKVIYLDSDLIVKGDVSELYATDLGDDLIGAVRDVDYLGMLNMKDGKRYEYSKSVLEMNDPYDYFQAGVLVLNTKALRKEVPTRSWLEMAQDDRYIYNDQDILNVRCEKRVTFLDPSWNVMHNGWNRIGDVCCHAPAAVFDAYLDAREHERIIHYAGSHKPWNKIGCDRSGEYWAYARDTPFYEQLIARFAYSCTDQLEQMDREASDYQLIDDDSVIRRIVDPILPPGSERRETVRALVKKVNLKR